ncbi:MAG: MarR family transcriptional regulator [Phaeodactylibacter sp.]|nr:MarR family transcriptional regulator [Phaeodactylibacter sp.]
MPTSALTTQPNSEVLGFIIERTAKRMKQACQQRLKAAGFDITVDQWVILQELDKEDGLNQYEIAKKTYKDAPTITRIIDLLCKKKLTRRVLDSADRRRYCIRLTDLGRRHIEEILPVIQEFRLQAYQGLPTEDLKGMMGLLNTIFDNLDSNS